MGAVNFLVTAQQQPIGPPTWIVGIIAGAAVLVALGVIYLFTREHTPDVREAPLPPIPYEQAESYPRTSMAVPYDNLEVHGRVTELWERMAEVSIVPSAVTSVRPHHAVSVGCVNNQQHYVNIGHTLIARKTGGGKSNIVSMVVSQLLEQGVEVWYANAKYMPRSYDKKTRKLILDIDPMVRRCHRTAVSAKDLSHACLDLLLDAQRLVQDRIEQSQGPQALDGPFPPVVVVFDELKSAVSDWRRLERAGVEDAREIATEAIETILTKGREPNVFFVTTGQDAQVQSLKLSQGTMVNFQLKIAHPSLDNASLVNLLPKGVNRDRLPAVSSPYQWYVTSEGDMGSDIIEVVDVPLVTQDYLTERLKSVPVRSIQEPAEHEAPPPSTTEVEEQEDDDMPFENMDETLALVVAWLIQEPKISQNEVAKRLWPNAARSKGGAGSYGVKAKRLMDRAKEVLQRSSNAPGGTGTSDDGVQPGDILRLGDELDLP